jgi:hypothetical protein
MDGGVKISSILVIAFFKARSPMNNETCNPEQLQAVIADAYRVFGCHSVPAHPLDACTACCMPPKLEQEMRQLPLTKLTGKHYYEYNTAAKGPVQPSDEVLYLLPRMLELMAKGDEVHHSIELSLQRLGCCADGSLGQSELEVLTRFALAYFQCALVGDRGVDGIRGMLEEPLSILLMFHIGGVAIEPLLALWMRTDSPQATIQFVETTYWRFWERQDYDNPFAEDQPTFKAQIKRWLSEPEHRQRWVQKLLAPEFQRLAELQGPRGSIDFKTMVDAAFDQLTQ